MENSSALKYRLFKQQDIEAFANALNESSPSFDRQKFLSLVFDEVWDNLELKERISHLTKALHACLPQDFRSAAQILRDATPREAVDTFLPIVSCDYVAEYGLNDWETSIAALEDLTQRGSAEFAIRPFIQKYPKKTMAKMLEWTQHPSEHVRRLASEGCRPRLPWHGVLYGFVKEPQPIFPILEALKDDLSDYVRRSVANNLNDISKDNPEIVLDLLSTWQEGATDARQWLIKHALRTLLKAGNTRALAILGYGAELSVELLSLTVDKSTVKEGEFLEFSFELISASDKQQEIILDYVLHSVKADGSRSKKVWKLKTLSLAPQERLRVSKRHSFKPVTTRKHYSGEHLIQLQINGDLFGEVRFHLQV